MERKRYVSLQDILRSRTESSFVGREEQLDFYRENLSLPPGDERRSYIINVFGLGGVGKTRLIQNFEQLAKDAGVITAFIDSPGANIPEIMWTIAEQIGRQGFELKSFLEEHQRFIELRQKIETDPAAPQGAFPILGRALAIGGIQLARTMPVLGMDTNFFDEDSAAQKATDWADYIYQKLTNEAEIQLLLEPIRVLTPFFINDLKKMANPRSITFLFDSYEGRVADLDRWLLELLEGKYGDVPITLEFVISGRIQLDKSRWGLFAPIIYNLRLGPFTNDEAREYLARRTITNEKAVDTILGLSSNLPLLLALLADQSPDDPSLIGYPDGTATARFLKWVEEPERRQVVLDCATPRSLNRDVLAVVIQGEVSDSLFQWLTGLSMVVGKKDRWFYHDTVRPMMIQYNREQRPTESAALHARLYNYYQELNELSELKEVQGLKSAAWKAYALEALYHSLCSDPVGNIPNATQGFLNALMMGASEFAVDWVKTMQQGGRDVDSEVIVNLARAFDDLIKKHAPPPDLSIQIHVDVNGSKSNIAYVLDSPNNTLGFHNHPAGNRALLGSPREFQSHLMKKIEALAEGKDIDGRPLSRQQIPAKLGAIGNILYDDLFSNEMKAAYRKWRNEAMSVQITSDEPWIPWELIKPYDDSNLEQIIDDDFLCMKFHLTRWLSGEQGSAGFTKVTRLVCVEASHVPGAPPLEHAVAERQHISTLAKNHSVEDKSPLKATSDTVGDLLDNGGIEMWHFACHGNFEAGFPDESVILLSDGYGLRVEDIHGRRQTAISRDRPLFFLNACRVGQQGWKLTRLGGWAATLVGRCQCGAFIGPLWAVNDSLAYEFAKSFYESLEQGQTIGAAVRTARQSIRILAPDNPTWLAYSVYGHPNGHVVWSGQP